VPHRSRGPIDPRHPCHLTLRLRRGGRSLRAHAPYRAFLDVLRALREQRSDFRVLVHSLQHDHAHLIVEADSAAAFVSGARSLDIRLGLRLNRALGRKGKLFSDCYHRHELRTPREVRNAIGYVLNNDRKHEALRGPLPLVDEVPDPYSSGPWFDGWKEPIARAQDPPPVCAPATWLAAVGWKIHGPISRCEIPGGFRRA
jgi:REP element-mobilizing transposase RayT